MRKKIIFVNYSGKLDFFFATFTDHSSNMFGPIHFYIQCEIIEGSLNLLPKRTHLPTVAMYKSVDKLMVLKISHLNQILGCFDREIETLKNIHCKFVDLVPRP